EERSPLALLTELAMEGTSTLVEAQRTLLGLAQQENDIFMNGLKSRIGDFAPGVAMTDMVRRSVEVLISMQQELLTAASKQTLEWVEAEKGGKPDRPARLAEVAREAVETFAQAQKKLLEVVAEESARVSGSKPVHADKPVKKAELVALAREAAAAFIEAQKSLLDAMGQQMNVNLGLAAESMQKLSPAQLLQVANFSPESVKDFFDTETSLIGSLVKPHQPKGAGRAKPGRGHARQRKAVAV
ncbi:MAG TPA: hypothetical protein VE866_01215, partial [Candidatus Binatia bacterium]|nr:hypothetical protein [Candidatus Binatia bacterium]